LNEDRLDRIRREAAAPGGAPLPRASRADLPGYYGRPVVKAPPWTWEVPVYLFVGGLAGASAVLAFAARVSGASADLVSAALWIALGGAATSAPLLIRDLGRPGRFVHMLRVFKWRSPMSVGVWLLTGFGGAAALALTLHLTGAEHGVIATGAAAALLGAGMATYTGVLLAATVVPAWHSHARALPVHFGAAALGSAAALLELLGHRQDALHLLGLLAAATETVVWILTETHRSGAKDRALRTGRTGLFVRTAAALSGPVALASRLAGWRTLAAIVFLVGALLSRFAWLEAGRASARDPEAAL